MVRSGRSRCALVALFLLAALYPAGWSLCVAPGGHACWEPLTTAPGGSCEGRSAAPDDCATRAAGSCTDVSLTSSWLRAAEHDDLSPHATAAPPALGSRGPGPFPGASRLRQESPRRNPAGRQGSTTVLRC